MTQSTSSRQQTLQQKRAADAYKKVSRIKSDDKEYGSLVRGLPAMIQRDGLGQSLAFLLAKDKNEGDTAHRRAYDHLSGWLKEQFKVDSQKDLLEWLLEQPSERYRQVTTETQAYLVWLKRFAEARGLAKEEQQP